MKVRILKILVEMHTLESAEYALKIFETTPHNKWLLRRME
jgi:hypothetical protein